MAGSSLLALIDDIATLLDDVSVMTKVAVKKTAGVLGDDLALNAQQVSGVNADRELPVVWAVCKGSFINKLILVPAALAISALESWLNGQGIPVQLIIPLMLIGGAFLCFEGSEKIVHSFFHKSDEDNQLHQELLDAVANPEVDIVAYEKDKIKGAIRTDFILSAEIIVITLGAAANSSLSVQIGVLTTIAMLMTIGVYGIVAGIIKLDDIGLHLIKNPIQTLSSKLKFAIGRFLLWGAPWLMKTLSVVGTAAMFLVGGGIFTHNLPVLHHAIEKITQSISFAPVLVSIVLDGVIGVLIGLLVVLIVSVIAKFFKKKAV